MQALATITSPKGVITIDGFSSHLAPINDEDAEALKAIELDEAGLKKEFRIGGWVRSMKGAALVKEHIFGPTCTICGIQTGHTEAGAKTVLPSTAMARLDFRLVPDLTPPLVLQILRAHLDIRGFKDIEIIELGSAPLAKASATSRVARCSDRARSGSLRDRRRWFIQWILRVDRWALFAAFPLQPRQSHRLESVMRGRIRMVLTKTFAWMIFCRASSSLGG